MGQMLGQAFSCPSFKLPNSASGRYYACQCTREQAEAERESSGTQAYDGREHLPLCFLDHRMHPTVLREPGAPGPGEQFSAREAGTSPRPRKPVQCSGGLGGQGQGAGHGAAPPTCLVRGDVDDCSLAGLGAQVRHAVDGLDPEGVVHVGQQVGHQQAGLHQARLLGHEAGAAPALLAVAQRPGAAAAHGVVGDVAAAARVQWGGPLQGHRGPIHTGDEVHWC